MRAVEAAAVNYFLLAKNIELNGLEGRAIGLNIALHDRTGLGALSMSRTDIGSSNHTYEADAVSDSPGGTQAASAVHRQAVVGYSMDDFIEMFHPEFPKHIKMDVDGNETLILRGSRATRVDPRLRSMVIEIREETHDEVLGLLGAAGLTDVRYLRVKPSKVSDVLFVRP